MPDKRESNSFRKVLFFGLLSHILVFILVLDLYFKSPVIHGIAPITNPKLKPLAQRVVLFVADGLRADVIYDDQTNTPYLTEKLRNHEAASGVVNTRVPTESRPGHVALLGGLYEDPSAIMTGWQHNIVEFDSVINQSNYAWCIGSPDIVKIFPKSDHSKLSVIAYDPSDEDFSGKTSTINQDRFVFDHMKNLLNISDSCEMLDLQIKRAEKKIAMGDVQENYNLNNLKAKFTNCVTILEKKSNCGALCNDGVIFFLHLLGMDTAGHVYKPGSKEYISNLQYVDNGVEEMVELIDAFFGDKETAYLFTADHGMTNWGSHGDGTDHETIVPFIAWGKGIREDNYDYELDQADVAPIIASLLAIPIPVNSMGIVNPHLFNGSLEHVYQLVHRNLEQIAGQYIKLSSEYETDIFFKDYPPFRGENNLQNKIYSDKSVQNYEESINTTIILIKDVLKGIEYLRYYYFAPKLGCIFAGILLFMLYLAVSLYSESKYPQKKSRHLYYVPLVWAACMFTYLYVINSTIFGYIYLTFPLVVLCSMLFSANFMNQFWAIIQSTNKMSICLNVVLIVCLIEILVVGFFYKFACSLTYGIVIWGIDKKRIENKDTLLFIFIGAIMALSLFIPTSTSFSYYGLLIGAVLWIGVYIYLTYKNLNMNMRHTKIGYLLMLAPLFIFLLSLGNAIQVALSFDAGNGVSIINQTFAWICTVLSLILMTTSSNGIYERIMQISGSLSVPLTLMSVHIDLIMFSLLTGLLYLWVHSEAKNANKFKSTFDQVLYVPSNKTKHADFKRTYFYVSLTICHFFAIGNLASFNGFDPLWTRAYVTTFNPILMAALIIFKMIIPFFTITCTFHAIVILTESSSTMIFKMILLYLDVMVLNFLCFIKNEGSWKDIGKSLSHFVIMEAMALVMLLFYALARYVTAVKMFPFLYRQTPIGRKIH